MCWRGSILVGAILGLALGGDRAFPADLDSCHVDGVATDIRMAACSKIIAASEDKQAIAEALNTRGLLYDNNGDFDKALADFGRSLQIRPGSLEIYVNRCNVYREKADYDRALADCGKAIELDSADFGNYLARGSIYIATHDYERAIADLTKSLEINPDYAANWNERGQAYLLKGDYDKAIADNDKALELSPRFLEAYRDRGEAYLHKGDYDQATLAFKKALEINPGYTPAVDGLSEVQKARTTQVAAVSPAALAPASARPAIEPQVVITPSAAVGRRVALVIGNSSYRAVTELPNPARDADLVGGALRQAGVDVTVAHDLDRSGMVAALNAFADKADGADWAIVYYAGHGIEMDGHNYLIPVDAILASDRSVEDETVSLDRMMSTINGAKQLKLVVLDACRNNPFHPKITALNRSIDRGLSRVEPDGATLVVYAAKEGTVAKDGTGTDSPFAVSFAKRIDEPGVEINKVLRFVRQDVLEATDREQEPFVYGSLPPTDFFFVPAKP
ncbi:caspase family protein [Labrys wisconsinensis]|uniref:Tetratricopeptide (TPR) repeat protein n=1 Tax=Labrys wisconsinensis TaxID=425677 RepID=A0ABU0JFD7_9HYPH|nr:caspase family protein [Labrys wisconsinensis]MDQ0472998.1 tetratricopeptide (TPR) repeat protein [Labrys wisconsinensis]